MADICVVLLELLSRQQWKMNKDVEVAGYINYGVRSSCNIKISDTEVRQLTKIIALVNKL